MWWRRDSRDDDGRRSIPPRGSAPPGTLSHLSELDAEMGIAWARGGSACDQCAAAERSSGASCVDRYRSHRWYLHCGRLRFHTGPEFVVDTPAESKSLACRGGSSLFSD